AGAERDHDELDVTQVAQPLGADLGQPGGEFGVEHVDGALAVDLVGGHGGRGVQQQGNEPAPVGVLQEVDLVDRLRLEVEQVEHRAHLVRSARSASHRPVPSWSWRRRTTLPGGGGGPCPTHHAGTTTPPAATSRRGCRTAWRTAAGAVGGVWPPPAGCRRDSRSWSMFTVAPLRVVLTDGPVRRWPSVSTCRETVAGSVPVPVRTAAGG